MSNGNQFGRKASLLIMRPGQVGNNPSAFVPESNLDLSQFQFRFRSTQSDVETPNNCEIRVYNLSDETVDGILKSEFARVVVQAGYEDSFGVVFQGDIKQYRRGRETATTSYLDILAADGDLAYNYAVVRQTVAAGVSAKDRVLAIAKTMVPFGVELGLLNMPAGGTSPRGKVLFGMARALLRQETRSVGATWSITNGRLNILPLDGYLPNEAVVLSHLTGLVGIPEQTEQGIRARCLMNPRIQVGGLVKIDNRSVNQIVQQDPTLAGKVPFNRTTGPPQLLASVTSDGVYRVFVAEHFGDTRGQDWYTDLTCLSIDPATDRVLAP